MKQTPMCHDAKRCATYGQDDGTVLSGMTREYWRASRVLRSRAIDRPCDRTTALRFLVTPAYSDSTISALSSSFVMNPRLRRVIQVTPAYMVVGPICPRRSSGGRPPRAYLSRNPRPGAWRGAIKYSSPIRVGLSTTRYV